MSGGGGFTLVDFSIPARDLPLSHPHAQAPLCLKCQKLDLCFFNPSCDGCQDLLLDQSTSIAELFAVMRQWVPQTQRNMSSLTREILRRGANINDRDGLTDLTLLHYASKSGAAGVGNELSAANLVKSLISKGAESEMRCRWTDMNALHYATYFDCPEVIESLADHNPSLVMSICSEFNGGNGLHIAASNFALSATKVLIRYGADGSLKDRDGKQPFECIPENCSEDQKDVCEEMTDLLKYAADNPPKSMRTPSQLSTPKHTPRQTSKHSPAPPPRTPTPNRMHETTAPAPPRSPIARATGTTEDSSGSSRNQSPMPEELSLEKLGLRVGDRVVIDASSSRPKYGTVRYGGRTEFQKGQWAGVELDADIGKNDGSYAGIKYFTCKEKYGIFVPMHRVSKALSQPPEKKRKKKSELKARDSLYTTNKAIEAQAQIQMNSELQVGEKVIVGGTRIGVIRFKGTVSFAPGFWLGVELDTRDGKNDGSVNGVRYFTSRLGHGLFVLSSKVKRYTSSFQTKLDPTLIKSNPSSTNPTPSSSSNESTDYSSSGAASQGFSTSTNGTSGLSDASASSHAASPSARRRGTSSNRSTPRSKGRLTTAGSGSSSPAPLLFSMSSDLILEDGMSVFANKEMGIIRFIGETEFAPGSIWLGVELRKPNGKNDGSVQGTRYFSCKPNHGLFVKPEKATHRGINCAKITPIKLTKVMCT
ncbi:CAP-Gly domain-containing linker protein 4-like isoform X2 [Halichondria panicea]|uniref:CAP-Gly domain-containing linker protein 4-like isoform X2 n=1 Tax=Halichondria panicea TaxID=6063 RepID=UPI00312BADDA